jgi:arylsulfatase A-like enzyme
MLALTAPRVVPTAAANDPQPDIVLVVLDALRAASLPIYGHPRDTAPFLSILARQATLFKHCYTTALWTRPAITGLLTGLLPIEHGQWRFGKTLPENMPTFPRLLSKQGYRTAYFTANTAVGEKYGLEGHFDHVSDAAAVAEDPGSWLTRDLELWAGGQEQSQGPLFVLAHYLPPHGPYDPPTRHLDAMMEGGYGSVDFLPPHARDVDVSLNSAVFGRIPYYQAKVSFSTDPRSYLTRYEANVRYGDALARDLYERWQALGRSRRTLFVITSDHGECMGEHGLFFAHGRLLHDSILHVPLIVHDSADPTGRVVEDAVSHVDVTATVLDWSGSTERLGRGVSLAAGARPAHPIVSQDFAKVGESGWALSRGRWRLVYNDCPRWGNAHVLAVRSGVRGRRGLSRIPLPAPATALPEPFAIAPGVSLESLALHATQAEAGEEMSFSGAARLEGDAAGVLEIRQRVPGSEAVPVLRRECGGARGSAGSVALDGAITAPEARPGEPVETIWEARFTPVSSAGEAPWRRLFSFPVARSQQIAPGLDLVGASVEPGVARPGEVVTLRTAWRIGRPPPADAIVAIDLVGPDGTRRPAPRAAGRAREGDGAEVIGFASVARLREMPERFGLRLLDAARLVVPSRAAPGIYRVVVRPAEGGRARAAAQRPSAATDTSGAADAWGSEVVAATLEVAPGPGEALARVVERELGPPSLAVLAAVEVEPERLGDATDGDGSDAGVAPSESGAAASAPGASVDAQLGVLVERFPTEGHPLYLLARRARDPEARQALLDRCLERVPFHRAALAAASAGEKRRAALAAASQGAKARPALERLQAARPLDYRFDGRVHLYGANLRRAPEGASGLYLSLYWEALAPVGETLEAIVQARTTTRGESRTFHLRYLLGQTVRPSHTWRIGECIVDVLHLRVPDDAERVAVDLVLRPAWRYDAEEKDPVVLIARHSSGSARTRVLVASAALADLPRAGRDLLRAKRRDPIAYRLYDVAADPAEANDLVAAEPAVFAEMHAALLPLLEHDWTTREEGPKADVPAATQERLRALGYAE